MLNRAFTNNYRLSYNGRNIKAKNTALDPDNFYTTNPNKSLLSTYPLPSRHRKWTILWSWFVRQWISNWWQRRAAVANIKRIMTITHSCNHDSLLHSTSDMTFFRHRWDRVTFTFVVYTFNTSWEKVTHLDHVYSYHPRTDFWSSFGTSCSRKYFFALSCEKKKKT